MERRIDMLGRINIPREMLRRLNIPFGRLMEFSTDGENIIVKKSSCCCAFCGSIEELKDVKGTRVCGPCVEEIKEGVFFDAIVLLE